MEEQSTVKSSESYQEESTQNYSFSGWKTIDRMLWRTQAEEEEENKNESNYQLLLGLMRLIQDEYSGCKNIKWFNRKNSMVEPIYELIDNLLNITLQCSCFVLNCEWFRIGIWIGLAPILWFKWNPDILENNQVIILVEFAATSYRLSYMQSLIK